MPTLPAAQPNKPLHMPHLDDAACLGHATHMDGGNYENITTGLSLCHTCPERQRCQEWVNSLSNHQKRNCLTGVMAGRVWGESKRWLSPRERKQLGGVIPK